MICHVAHALLCRECVCVCVGGVTIQRLHVSKSATPHAPVLLEVKIVQHPQKSVCNFILWVLCYVCVRVHAVPERPIMCEVLVR